MRQRARKAQVEYFLVLISANVRHDIGKTRECMVLLEPLRTAWHEAALKVSMEQAALRRDAVG